MLLLHDAAAASLHVRRALSLLLLMHDDDHHYVIAMEDALFTWRPRRSGKSNLLDTSLDERASSLRSCLISILLFLVVQARLEAGRS